MINKIDMGDWQQALVGRARSVVFLGGASVISLTERQTENYINLTIIKTVFCDSHFSTITECCYFHYILCKIIQIFMTAMID